MPAGDSPSIRTFPHEVVRLAIPSRQPFRNSEYWGTDVCSLMKLAAESRPCAEYLMGNHVYAQRMFQHDPSVMLYAPLRTAIYVDRDDRTWFTIDQPGTRFDSLHDQRIAQVGRELDAELAALLEHLGLPVPAELITDAHRN